MTGGQMNLNQLEQDLRDRWLPSAQQRFDAEEWLKAGAEYVYTVQILLNKEYGLWTEDVIVDTPRGVFPTRDAASAFAVKRVNEIRANGGTATGSYARHYLDKEGYEQAAVFEDIMTWNQENDK